MSDEHGHAASSRKPNRLIHEQSPYLRQHAHNPVDWYPWGEEALARARAENKPILLSIGYSACHWCHVMERESFENEQIARLMNENFISIKVDREERPDLDQVYMDAVQLLTGRGGWPLTVFLTPEGKPFFGGTYFPPVDRQGMPAFPRVLLAISAAFHEKPADVQQNVERLGKGLAAMAEFSSDGGEIGPDALDAAAQSLAQHYDRINGGIGRAPKFPNTFVFSFFLRRYQAGGDLEFSHMVRETLSRMAKGGVYDQLGGGFHRYSVDERWLIPHFEKMLYDNSQLTRLYLDAGRALSEPEFLTVARETLDYVLREMTGPDGSFYSTQDADSEGEEGRFFLWTPAEARAVLGEKLAPIAERYFDISEEGNFEDRNILHRTIGPEEAARLFKRNPEEMEHAIEEIRRLLFEARERRVKPGRDEKILAAWNGMMLGAMAEGYRALGDDRYLKAAKRAADFILTRLWDGRALKRSYKDGVARFNAYLEDYALVANGMIDLYEASLDARYLETARTMAEAILNRFLDRDKGGFFFTSTDHEQLVTRSKAVFDGSTPSGNSAAVMALLRLYSYTGDVRYFAEAQRTFRLLSGSIAQQPFAFSHMLEAVDLYQRGPVEIVFVGERGSPELSEWLERLGLFYIPNRALFVADPRDSSDSHLPEQVRGKTQVDGKLTAYVCRERTCTAPITSFDALKAELES
jgi:uncharacterized protein YyaL (SSP411 family)